MNRIADIVTDPNQLMFGDEASKDERTSNRRKGWSRRGVRCVQRKCFVRGNRYSLLPIITLDGIITHDIIRGSVTSERFVEFLRELVVSLGTAPLLLYQLIVCYRYHSLIHIPAHGVSLFWITAAFITQKRFGSLLKTKHIC
jgi:hypothetical protein